MAVTPWTRLGRFIESRSREGVELDVSYPAVPAGIDPPPDRPWRLRLTLHSKYPAAHEPRRIGTEGQKLEEVIGRLIDEAEAALPELDAVL